MLIVGGFSATASASEPCPPSIAVHHHVPASGSHHAPDGKATHCLTLASHCCAVVQPAAVSMTRTIVQPMTMIWHAPSADEISGQPTKVATPPPRS
jgi:hypothetical protein